MIEQGCQYICRHCGRWVPVSCKDYDRKALFYCLRPACQQAARKYIREHPPKKSPKAVISGLSFSDSDSPAMLASISVPDVLDVIN